MSWASVTKSKRACSGPSTSSRSKALQPGDTAYLREIVQSAAGQPFSEANIAADRDAILSYFFNNGYPDAYLRLVADTLRVSRTAPICTTTSSPASGSIVRDVSGPRPRNHAAERGHQPHPDASGRSRFHRAASAETQQRLYDLGIFSKVQTALQNPDGEEESKYVLIPVGRGGEIFLQRRSRRGAGADRRGRHHFRQPGRHHRLQPACFRGISRLNFLGRAHTLSLQTLASTLEQRGVLSYLMPEFTRQRESHADLFRVVRQSRRHAHFCGAAHGRRRPVGPAPVARQ